MAIASAINWARHIARTGDVKQWKGPQTVNPKSVAEVRAALALWEAMKAAARGRRATDTAAGHAGALDLAASPAETRRRMASRGVALPDGSYPVPDLDHLRRAVLAYGRAPEHKRAAVRRHLIRRARALGGLRLIPSDWLT